MWSTTVFVVFCVTTVIARPQVSYYGQELQHPVLTEIYHHNKAAEHLATAESKDNAVDKDNYHREKRDISFYPHKEEHIPIIGKDGVPLDTPEVQKAKEHHFLAHEVAKIREHNPHHEYEEEEGYVAATGEHHHPHEYIPVISKSGVPIDTPEVRYARKQHMAAVAAAKERQYHKIITEPKEEYQESYIEHPEQEIAYEQHLGGIEGGYEYGHE